MIAPARPPRSAASVFRGREAVAAGLLTRHQLASRAWRRLLRGVYADSTLPPTHGIAIAGAALIVPRSAVFGGPARPPICSAHESLVDSGAAVEVIVPEEDRFGPVSRYLGCAGPRVPRIGASAAWAGTPARRHYGRPWTSPPGIAAGVGAWPSMCCWAGTRLSGAADRRGTRALPSCRGRTRAAPSDRSRRRTCGVSAGDAAVGCCCSTCGAGAGRLEYSGASIRPADSVARVDLAFPQHRLAVEYDGAWHGEAGELTAIASVERPRCGGVDRRARDGREHDPASSREFSTSSANRARGCGP